MLLLQEIDFPLVIVLSTYHIPLNHILLESCICAQVRYLAKPYLFAGEFCGYSKWYFEIP